MKYMLAEIRGIQRGLVALSQMTLPITLSYRLGKLMNVCNEEAMAIEEARVKLVKQYAKDDPDKPGELMVTPEHNEKFKEEFIKFLQEETEIDFTPIPISEFGDVKISPLDISGLSKIITDK